MMQFMKALLLLKIMLRFVSITEIKKSVLSKVISVHKAMVSIFMIVLLNFLKIHVSVLSMTYVMISIKQEEQHF